jgi:hypothetical protein
MSAHNGEVHRIEPAMAELRHAWGRLVAALGDARLVSA